MANLSSFASSNVNIYGSIKTSASAYYPGHTPISVSTTPGKLIGIYYAAAGGSTYCTFSLTIDGVTRTYDIREYSAGEYNTPFYTSRAGSSEGFLELQIPYNTLSITNNTTWYIKAYYMDKI